ncbi:uncharacterized protein LOC131146579 [Malania oleifera]|uniref:uncharacterized protein LOC131146579 n=1 Tax=Malania oleifera TaxID=397392 RepID=UPI0025AE4FBE|nr:uncharacterized protein LOC131146579 [Malania oleifera]
MASAAETRQHHHQPTKSLSLFLQSTASNLFSVLSSNTQKPPAPKATPPKPPSKVCMPLLFAGDSPPQALPLPFSPPPESTRSDSLSSPAPESKGSSRDAGGGFPSTVSISGLNSGRRAGGPAFVGQVFSMCDLSGTGLMAVSTHFDIPFISKRTPDWMKKMFATITKSERNGPVFRFFMDLGDAVTYVKRLNIPSGVVGACRLDLAYEHFKEKPHLFQFVPNEKQVKEANKLLKTIPQNDGRQRVDGVPVFTAQNLDIAIATTDGIKWYTPYFFDKNMLDNILEESVDQHFHALIQSRRTQRWRDVVDDNLAEVVEENGDSLWEPPEVQEVMDEMGHPGIPLSVISKAAEMQLLYAVDRVLLGNRWLRKAAGIQPKFPYMVDSFERRSAVSFLKASESSSYIMNSQTAYDNSKDSLSLGSSELKSKDSVESDTSQKPDVRFPFGDWFNHPWSKQQHKLQNKLDPRTERMLKESVQQELEPNPFLPKITMVGISTGEAGQMSKATLKKTMEDLTRQLEQTDRGSTSGGSSGSYGSDEFKNEDRDPLFVANVGDYFSRMGKRGSARWVRGGSN